MVFKIIGLRHGFNGFSRVTRAIGFWYKPHQIAHRQKLRQKRPVATTILIIP
jgi:hypothetical protein